MQVRIALVFFNHFDELADCRACVALPDHLGEFFNPLGNKIRPYDVVTEDRDNPDDTAQEQYSY
jgi:hypothetical protein